MKRNLAWIVMKSSVLFFYMRKKRRREGESYVKAIKFNIKWYEYRVNRTADKATERQITTGNLFYIYPTIIII